MLENLKFGHGVNPGSNNSLNSAALSSFQSNLQSPHELQIKFQGIPHALGEVVDEVEDVLLLRAGLLVERAAERPLPRLALLLERQLELVRLE